MKYLVGPINLLEQSSPCIVTSLRAAKKLAKTLGNAKELAEATKDFADTTGKILCVQISAKIERLLIIGGIAEGQSIADFKKSMASMASQLIQIPIKEATLDLQSFKVRGTNKNQIAQEIILSLSNISYQYQKHKSKPSAAISLTKVRLHDSGSRKSETGLTTRLGNALDAGLKTAKDLGNEPPNICNPSYLLRESKKLAKLANVKVSNLNEKKMEALGMGAFLAVSKGSDEPGHMIVIKYNGGKENEAPIALVGKGITFDTGGISLKPPPAMDEMKFDMCGAAAVIGATKAAIEAKLKINLVTIVAAAENMPSGKATRPGDVVRSYSGKTIEILNTDAEGRLVLCDAITHAKSFKPKVIIDVATLTGACIVALGSHASALYSNHDGLAKDLEIAANESGDRVWRMPLWDDYQAPLKSNFADMANVGGREAGSVVAACFLSRFAERERWAHLDIAGSAFHSGPQKGSSGRPVPLLFKYLQSKAT